MSGVAFVLIALGAYVGLVLFIAEFCALGDQEPTPPFKPLHVTPPADLREANERWMEHKAWTPEDVA